MNGCPRSLKLDCKNAIERDMPKQSYAYVPPAALTGSMRDFRTPKGQNLVERTAGFFEWQDLRRQNGLWPFSRATESSPGAVCSARDDRGNLMHGVNFASQDYLSLSSHPAIKQTAMETIEEYGVHSAGSPVLVGNTVHSVALERRIAEFLQMDEVCLYPTGWGAGFGAIRGLVRPNDHIVMDCLSHTCLQEGAQASTKNIYQFRHLDLEHCRRWLSTIRAKDTENGILVITEGLFSMDSDTPDIAAFQELAHEYGAVLMVDVAHDLGSLGEDGTGHIGMQNMLGKVDIVMGSFSKTFASNGGFVAVRSRQVKEYLRFYSPPLTFSNALSPVQAATVLKAFEIVGSAEGRQLRQSLMTNVLSLRDQIRAKGMEVYGDPSAIVCVKMGGENLARLVGRRLPELGMVANLVEFPAVAKGQARFRLQVMANHTPANIAAAVARLAEAAEGARAELDWMQAPAVGELKAIA
jgi:7-keto-8-aminopelargonate synthetase-like enzyme